MNFREDLHLFENKFKPTLGTDMNWPNLNASSATVSVHRVRDADVLRRMYTPWSLLDGKVVPCHTTGAAPMTIDAAVSRPKLWGSLGRANFDYHIGQYQSAVGPIVLELPAYRVTSHGEPEYLLIDGNHRAVALILTARPFDILLYAINGPMRSDILPDLIHWET